MLKKPSEEGNKNISDFKKFSSLKKGTKKPVDDFDGELEEEPFNDEDLPGNPNLPDDGSYIQSKRALATKRPKNHSTVDIKPEQKPTGPVDEKTQVKMIGKVAKFPKNVKASKAFNFLENVKISKNSIWYIMIEKSDELQMVKYNYKKGVDLNKFITELKGYYLLKYARDKKVCKLIEGIKVDGNDKYSMIKSIPFLKLEGGRPIISKI